jgi:hypothetical protein
MNLISLAFDFCTIRSKSKKEMVQSLSLLGFQFFIVEGEKNILRGLCKRKNNRIASRFLIIS